MGDLSGKLGTLQRLEPPHNTYSFYDENLHLLGPFTSKLKRAMCQPTAYNFISIAVLFTTPHIVFI